ncbi:class B sortase [Ruminococcaceae bacterium OttesenSCG-928-L11]|nr:class B sortase [Ruminococcaceae bacterium OttesenSCG-928-L11]
MVPTKVKVSFTLAFCIGLLGGFILTAIQDSAPHPILSPQAAFSPSVGEQTAPSLSRSRTVQSHGLAVQAAQKQALNEDTVGWLTVPDTGIDDVVLWREGDNDYYLRRNFDRRHSNSGVYYADKDCTFGDGTAAALGKNTAIYGHSLSDSKFDAKFGPMRWYLEEDFARSHPYLYFSTTKENLVWEVVAVFYSTTGVPYNKGTLDEDAFAAMFQTVSEQSLYRYSYEYSPDDKFLTLSTCVYSLPDQGALEYPNEYRLGIMARLVGNADTLHPDELHTEADFVRNLHIRPA